MITALSLFRSPTLPLFHCGALHLSPGSVNGAAAVAESSVEGHGALTPQGHGALTPQGHRALTPRPPTEDERRVQHARPSATQVPGGVGGITVAAAQKEVES
ncbi:unnamed protein product [Lampetra planeri]